MNCRAISVILAVVFCGYFIAGISHEDRTVQASSGMSVTVASEKSKFSLGTIATFETNVVNGSAFPVHLSRKPYVEIAYKERKDFRLYAPAGLEFTADGAPMPVNVDVGESLSWRIPVLWNDRPATAHLNGDAAQKVEEGRILFDYAFPVPGKYFVRAGVVVLNRSGEPERKIESEIIEIQVNEPAGKDLEIWRMMEANGRLGYFLQEGDLPRDIIHNNEQRESLLDEIELIMARYPDRFFAQNFRYSFARFRAAEEKRKAVVEKLRVKSEN